MRTLVLLLSRALHLPYTSKYFPLVQGSGVILGSAGQSDFYSPLLPLFSGFTKIRNSELGPVLLKFALFNGLRPLVKNVIFCSVSTAHWNMWNCAYQIYPRTIKVVSILSKFIFLDLKTCFYWKKRVSKEISYIVYISAILPNIVYISLVSLKKISLRPGLKFYINRTLDPPELAGPKILAVHGPRSVWQAYVILGNSSRCDLWF